MQGKVKYTADLLLVSRNERKMTLAIKLKEILKDREVYSTMFKPEKSRALGSLIRKAHYIIWNDSRNDHISVRFEINNEWEMYQTDRYMVGILNPFYVVEALKVYNINSTKEPRYLAIDGLNDDNHGRITEKSHQEYLKMIELYGHEGVLDKLVKFQRKRRKELGLYQNGLRLYRKLTSQ